MPPLRYSARPSPKHWQQLVCLFFAHNQHQLNKPNRLADAPRQVTNLTRFAVEPEHRAGLSAPAGINF